MHWWRIGPLVFRPIHFWTTQSQTHSKGIPRQKGEITVCTPRSRLTCCDQHGFAWAHVAEKLTHTLMTDTSFPFGCWQDAHGRLKQTEY